MPSVSATSVATVSETVPHLIIVAAAMVVMGHHYESPAVTRNAIRILAVGSQPMGPSTRDFEFALTSAVDAMSLAHREVSVLSVQTGLASVEDVLDDICGLQSKLQQMETGRWGTSAAQRAA